MLSILLHLYVLRIRSIIAFSFCFARYKRVVYLSLCKPKLSCTHCWISTEIYFRLVQLQFYHVPDYSRWKYSCDVNFPHERSRYSPLFLHSTAHAPFTKLVWLLLCNFIWLHIAYKHFVHFQSLKTVHLIIVDFGREKEKHSQWIL